MPRCGWSKRMADLGAVLAAGGGCLDPARLGLSGWGAGGCAGLEGAAEPAGDGAAGRSAATGAAHSVPLLVPVEVLIKMHSASRNHKVAVAPVGDSTGSRSAATGAIPPALALDTVV